MHLPQTRIYAGIGSRTTPPGILSLIREAAAALAAAGWILRTGGAEGADTAFLDGCLTARGRAELYLPWPGFRIAQAGDLRLTRVDIYPRPDPRAFEVAAMVHPHWEVLSPAVRKLMARNSHQIGGWDLETPCNLVLCWTPDGVTTADETSPRTGGTGQAIRLATASGIPVYNLRRVDHLQRVKAWLEQPALPYPITVLTTAGKE